MNPLKSTLSTISLWLIACLTLGLAPFFPQPHIVGKIHWVLGGAHGMKLIDWGDLALHGFPWVGLLGHTILFFARKKTV